MPTAHDERPILLLGAGGQVGRALAPRLARLARVVGALRADADFERPDELRALVRRVQPRVLVNAAAYTGVDDAERDAARCSRINAVAPAVLAEEASRLGVPIVHYSTNYVFDGAQQEPYREDAKPSPLSVYGATKLAGELAVADANPQHLILRTAGVYARTGRNFVRRMLELAHTRAEIRVVDDQLVSPTPAWLVADATVDALRRLDEGGGRAWGTYHLTTAGSASWFAFARRILVLDRAAATQRVTSLVATSSADYRTPARRPPNGVLAIDRFEDEFGRRLPRWDDALLRTMDEDETWS